MEVMRFMPTLCPPHAVGWVSDQVVYRQLTRLSSPCESGYASTVGAPEFYVYPIHYTWSIISVFHIHQLQVICWVTSTIYTQSLTQIPNPQCTLCIIQAPQKLRRNLATHT